MYLSSLHALTSKCIAIKNNNVLSPILLNITLDYETWQPLPPGKTVNWYNDIFKPTEQWMLCAEKYNFKLTFFVEMAELFWLRINNPNIAKTMEQQIKEMVIRGHDAQLHIHPAWLPEMGVTYSNKQWHGLEKNCKLQDLSCDIISIIKNAKDELENLTHKPITTFRAYGLQIYPCDKIVDTLLKIGIQADSSVVQTNSTLQHQPYFANTKNVAEKSTKQNFLEIPIFSTHNHPWNIDGYSADDVSFFLLYTLMNYGYNVSMPLKEKIKALVKIKASVPSDKSLIFTALGHTKISKSNDDMDAFFKELSNIPNGRSVTTSSIVNTYFNKNENSIPTEDE